MDDPLIPSPAPSPTVDYGSCACGGQYDERLVEVTMTVGEESVLMSDVPQGACPRCGARVYRTRVVEELEAVMRGRNLLAGR